MARGQLVQQASMTQDHRARIGAAAAGAIVLVVCATFTLGTVLVAPLGVLVARALARRQQRRLTRGAAWLGAVAGSFIAVPLVFAGLLAMAPSGTMAAVRSGMDSAQARQKPPELPEWLERINPQSAQRQSAVTQKMVSSHVFVVFFSIVGGLMACSFFATIAGSIGWLASMLFGYAITGRWLPSGDEIPMVATAEE